MFHLTQHNKHVIDGLKYSTLFASLLLITACGGGGGSDSTKAPEPNTPTLPNEPLPELPITPTPIDPVQPVEPIDPCKNNACVEKTSQHIIEPQIKSMLVNNRYDFSKITTTAQLSVEIQSLSPNICVVSAKDIQALRAGSCSLEFKQNGNATTLAATPVVKTIPVYTAEQAPATNVANCDAGVLAQSHKDNVLNMINDIRALHGLSAVKYDASHDDEMMQSSLIIAANRRLNHYPSPQDLCYSNAGYAGANSSNLGYRSSTATFPLDATNIVVNSMTEQYSASIGHRRWLLSPFLRQISVGAILHNNRDYFESASLKVIYSDDAYTPTQNPLGLIAYPYQDYPAKYFAKGVPLSLSIFTNQQSIYRNHDVDYSKANLVVTERLTGAVQAIDQIQFDSINMGLPNSLQFNFHQLQYNTIYDINVKNVRVNGQTQNYQYWFRIVE